MPTLFHFPLNAASRLVRLALAEKGIEAELKVEKTWERRTEFLTINPAGEVPVLVEDGGAAIADAQVICEFLQETRADPDMLGPTAIDRAETRRLMVWFLQKFAREVTDNLVGEKLLKRYLRLGTPRTDAIRAGGQNIHYHLDYIAFLTDRRNWLAGDKLSFADLAAAAHLSCVDYLGDVPWEKHPGAKDWYARVKSRPSFRPLLQESLAGTPPPKHYADLDF
ncbi:glutathione S-transferase family protein [Radicibacter daui]|uniref:glutathione S-transferase family protein n=1 Tax=Radicibacter daui TaxID=3064829 RepID=UPI004046F52E